MKKSLWIFCFIVFSYDYTYSCNVPVFRYALERWHPELFQVAFLYKDTLGNEDRDAAMRIQKLCLRVAGETFDTFKVDSSKRVNAEYHLINVNGNVSRLQKTLWGKYMSESLPKVIISFALSSGIRQPLWVGSPYSDELDNIFDSPVKRKVINSLLNGVTAVWVFVESGNESKDKKAFTALKEELVRNEKNIVLPTLTSQDSSDYLSSGPELKVSFELIKVSRNDIAEKGTVSMLEKIERPLAKMRNQPMAFPVFARGRALYALVGEGINSRMITQANVYLTGPCACTVKAQNPGVDLLLFDNWEGSLKTHYVKETQPPKTLFGLGEFLKRKEQEKKN